RPLVATCLVALGRLAPRRHRMPVAARPTTVRVIDRVHDLATDRRADAAPALGAGLADLAQAVLFVADFAEGRPAVDVEATHFARTHPDLGVDSLASHQARRSTGRAGDLGALARHHFDCVDRRADRNIPDRQRVTRTDRGIRATLQAIAPHRAARPEAVAPLAVGGAPPRDVRATVRIVFDALHGGRHAILVAAEIDDTVVGLVATTAMANRDAAVIVAPGVLLLTRGQRIDGPPLVQGRRDDPHHGPA